MKVSRLPGHAYLRLKGPHLGLWRVRNSRNGGADLRFAGGDALPAAIAPPPSGSESGQALWAVVGDAATGNLLQRAIRFRGVPHQLRRIPIDLIEVFTIRRNPVIARAAADVSTKAPEGAIALDNRTGGILGHFEFEG